MYLYVYVLCTPVINVPCIIWRVYRQHPFTHTHISAGRFNNILHGPFRHSWTTGKILFVFLEVYLDFHLLFSVDFSFHPPPPPFSLSLSFFHLFCPLYLLPLSLSFFSLSPSLLPPPSPSHPPLLRAMYRPKMTFFTPVKLPAVSTSTWSTSKEFPSDSSMSGASAHSDRSGSSVSMRWRRSSFSSHRAPSTRPYSRTASPIDSRRASTFSTQSSITGVSGRSRSSCSSIRPTCSWRRSKWRASRIISEPLK